MEQLQIQRKTMSLNVFVGSGRLTKDPTSGSAGDTPVAEFRIAIDGAGAKKDGKFESGFFSVVAFGKTAEFATNYLKKGTLIGLQATLRHEQWEKDGQLQSKVTLVANQFTFLEPKRDTGENGSEAAPAAEASVPDGLDPFAD